MGALYQLIARGKRKNSTCPWWAGRRRRATYEENRLRVLTKEWCNFFPLPVDVKSSKKSHSQVHHAQWFWNNKWSALEPGKPMPLATIVTFKGDCPAFTLYQIIFSDFSRVYFPGIRTIKPNLPSSESGHQPQKRFLITIPTFPVNESTGTATISFPDPEFVFFEPR